MMIERKDQAREFFPSPHSHQIDILTSCTRLSELESVSLFEVKF